MEMNTRIQVEHPVTEEVINYDLVKEQILIAAGVPISGKNYYPTRHAIECRINAEDPYNNFRPTPGRIEYLHKPGGHGVRVDTHVYAGYTIPSNYDSMIAKVIVCAQTREEAIIKMERALGEFIIEGPGLKTTIPLQIKLMQNEDFKKGNFTTAFMNTFDINK
jgi:acetyl-CoA carboxylase biotin carboxylase subunit